MLWDNDTYKPTPEEMTPSPVDVRGFYNAIRAYKATERNPESDAESRLEAAYLELIEAEYAMIISKLAGDYEFGKIHPRGWDKPSDD